ncbi:recombination mediator RecR [Candidatus Gracilibacteria bacterium]|nr:recombination mediator RecR [Candidatus Gracilibacteria bacterium]
MSLPKPITDAIESLSDLPGIGSRSAERLIFSLLKNESGLDQKISTHIGNLRSGIYECEICHHFCEQKNTPSSQSRICSICDNASRDKKLLCVVESPLDLVALERTHEFKGYYHVLHGVISPLNKVQAEDIRVASLLQRVKNTPIIEEIILATSGTTESDATAMYIVRELQNIFTGRISRLARGIPSGGDLDYLDLGTLSRAMCERREF